MGRTACTEPQCLYRGALYLTSVPVQGCTLPFLNPITILSIPKKSFFAMNVPRLRPFVLLIRFSMEMKLCMEYWWSDTGRGKQRYWDKNLYCCRFVYRKFHIDRPGRLNPGHCGERPAANRLTCGNTGLTKITVANKYRRMRTYGRTPLIRINRDDESSGSSDIPDNWIFIWK